MNVRDYKLISDQVSYAEVERIISLLESVLKSSVAGDVVELGCYQGTTSLLLQRCLSGTGKTLHVYDSFEGLPNKTNRDESPAGTQFVTGELSASKKQLITHFKQANLPLPSIHKGWFSDLVQADIPDQICFAFLDGDYYESITDSLRLIWPNLQPGAVVVVDDYQSEALPGARRAVDQWLSTRSFTKFQVADSLAILHL